MQIIKIVQFVFVFYAAILMVIGPILNLLCSITCFASQLHKYPSFVYIGVISTLDSIAMITSQLKNLLAAGFGYYPFDDNFYGVKFWIWVANMSMESGSLIMVNLHFNFTYSTNIFYI